MKSFIQDIASRLSEVWRSPDHARRGHTHRCQCERPVFFRNSQCLGCGAALGYVPDAGEVRALLSGPDKGTWLLSGETSPSAAYRRCANFDTPAGCNWLVPAGDESALCVACRLNRTIPDLADADNQRYWRAIENAKRRLVAQLLALGLPVKSKVSETDSPGRNFATDGARATT